MACLGAGAAQSINASQTQIQLRDEIHPSYSKARRPALIPPNSSLTLAEAEELVRYRIYQPLFPPPDPALLEKVETTSTGPMESQSAKPEAPPPPKSSPPRNHSCPNANPIPAIILPSSVAKDPRRRAIWLKARAHYARDWRLKQSCPFGKDHCPQPSPEVTIQHPRPMILHSKRRHSAFVRDEELMCLLEDRVGTPHLSELVPGDDVGVEEQGPPIEVLGGKERIEGEEKAEVREEKEERIDGREEGEGESGVLEG